MILRYNLPRLHRTRDIVELKENRNNAPKEESSEQPSSES